MSCSIGHCKGSSGNDRKGRVPAVRAVTLPIDIFAVFDRQDVKPLGAGVPVEHPIRPHAVGPDLLLLELSFEWLAVERVLGKMAEGFLDFVFRHLVERLEILRTLAG